MHLSLSDEEKEQWTAQVDVYVRAVVEHMETENILEYLSAKIIEK